MRKLTIDEIWDYTKRMWKRIVFQKEVLEDKRSVATLKRVWLKENAPEFSSIEEGCFFCEEAGGCNVCDKCPGRAVDIKFTCKGLNSPHHFNYHPGAFYREILRLDEIGTAALVVPVVVGHEWKVGDVFECYTGEILVYVKDNDEDLHVLGATEFFADEYMVDVNADESATFLFNIADALSDRGIA